MRFRDALEMFLLSAVWGASFILIKLSGNDLPPVWVALGRLTFGSLLLWAVLKLGRYSLPPMRLLGPLLAVAVLNNALPFCFFAWGERTVPSSTAAIVNATTPIWGLVLGLATGGIALGARSIRNTVAGVALGFLGVLLVVYGRPAGNGAGGNGYLFGVILIAIAAFSYGAGAVAAKRWLHGVEPVVIATLQLTLAWLVLLPLGAFGPHPAAIHFKSLAAVTMLGVFGSGLAYLVYFRLLANTSPTHTLAVTFLLPVWGIFWGFVAGEPIRWTALAGTAVILAGLVSLNLRPRPRRSVRTTVSSVQPCSMGQS
jgi:drug/metabolite transporter (DMT)-like permease